MKIANFTLAFANEERVEIPCSGVNIFVGPNNSGKSLALREIELCVRTGDERQAGKIVKNFEVVWPDQVWVEEHIQRLSAPEFRESGAVEHIWLPAIDNLRMNRRTIHFETFAQSLRHRQNRALVVAHTVGLQCLRLDGRARFSQSNTQPMGDLLAPVAESLLAHIFRSDEIRKSIRNYIREAFGLYFTIDPTLGGQLRVRLSAEVPLSDEQSLSAEARAYHGRAELLSEASDGVQAYVAIIMSALSSDSSIVLVDEPEAFLHPPLAKLLGNQLTKIMKNRGGALFVATHSADFLTGCLEASRDVNIVRLNRNDGATNGRFIGSSDLLEIIQSPLLRNSSVLSALFFDGAVVCEADGDRVFYSEVIYRILEQNRTQTQTDQSARRPPAILFLNGRGKDSVRKIIGPLRRFGIPAAAIVDLDILKVGGEAWMDLLRAAQVPEMMFSALGAQRAQIKQKYDDIGQDMKKVGINALDVKDRQAAQHLLDLLQSYGVFAVPVGQIEGWLKSLQAVGDKDAWVKDVLEKMGSKPDSVEYVRPFNNDVWKFISEVMEWVVKTPRNGT